MPTAPTITVTDNEDGTATVAVSGSDAGTTNTAYYAPINYYPEDGSNWTASATTSTGDGNISVTPVYVRNTGGVYLWRVESDDGAIAHSNIVQSRVSKSAQSVHERCVEAIHAQVQAIGLDGLSTNQIVLQTTPDIIRDKMIIVAPWDNEVMLKGQKQRTNARDDFIKKVIVAHIDPGNRDQGPTKRDRRMKWRQDITRTFASQHLTGVDEVYDMTISYRAIVDDNAFFKKNMCLGAMIIECTTREVRTL